MTVGRALAQTSERLAKAGCDTPRVDAEILVAHVSAGGAVGARARGLSGSGARGRGVARAPRHAARGARAARVRRRRVGIQAAGARRRRGVSSCRVPRPRSWWSAASRGSRLSRTHACSTSAREAARSRSRSPTSIRVCDGDRDRHVGRGARGRRRERRCGPGSRSSFVSGTSSRASPVDHGISWSRTRPTSCPRRSRRSSRRCATGSLARRSSGSGRRRPSHEAQLEVLRPGGALVLEVASGDAERVATLLRELQYETVSTTRDLAGRDRVVEATRP